MYVNIYMNILVWVAAHVFVGPSKVVEWSDTGNLLEAHFKYDSIILCLFFWGNAYYPNPTHMHTASLTGQLTFGRPCLWGQNKRRAIKNTENFACVLRSPVFFSSPEKTSHTPSQDFIMLVKLRWFYICLVQFS